MLEDFFASLLFYYEAGGFVMPPLLLATVVLWYAIGYRFSALKRGNKRSVRVLIERYRQSYDREPQGMLDDAVIKGLALARQRKPFLRRHLDDALSDYQRELRRHRILIDSIVAVAPVLGLLGTVVGMIETFDSLGDMALFSQSGGIAGGISQALFTTQMGLAVAIPGLVVGRALNKKQQAIEAELAQIKDILCSDPLESIGETR